MITGPPIVTLAEFVIGGLDLALVGRLLWRTWRARTWPIREGQLVSAELKQRGLGWVVRVQYRYPGRAGPYTGSVISPEGGPAFLSEELGRWAIAQNWQPGATVKVHVNPDDPRDAMLSPRIPFPAVLVALAGGAALVAMGLSNLRTW